MQNVEMFGVKLMKGGGKMKESKKMTVLGVEGIEDGLMGMGRLIEAGGPWTHPEMERIPEWRGADVRITSDFEREFNELGYFDHDLTVRTRHAGPVTWYSNPDGRGGEDGFEEGNRAGAR